MTEDRTPLFSVTAKDFIVEQFKRSKGKGGQKVNKTSSACRITHEASGVAAEAHDSRHFHENRKTAFLKVTNDPKFKSWLKVETAKHLGDGISIEERVEQEMKNIKIDVRHNGKWMEEGFDDRIVDLD
jgi:hypothetical protein